MNVEVTDPPQLVRKRLPRVDDYHRMADAAIFGRYRKVKPLPTDVLLLIEVAESSLRYDREIKRPLYAAHGVPEYWLIDVQGEKLTRFSSPTSLGHDDEEDVVDPSDLRPVALPGVRPDLSGLF